MNKIEVIDNFLNDDEYEKLLEMYRDIFPWNFSKILMDEDLICDKKYNNQYVHGIYKDNEPISEFFYSITPILKKAKVRSLVRAQINSCNREDKVVIHGFHVDEIFSENLEGNNGLKSSIFYMNTNDGFTAFEDGTKVESVQNRLLTFPANIKHSGTTCTNIHRRIVINLVYF